jgi:hypothetical protein
VPVHRRRLLVIGLPVLALAVVVTAVVVVVRSLGLPWLSRDECTATSNGHTVTLSLEEAERAGAIAARVVASRQRARVATRALEDGIPGRRLDRGDAGVLASGLTGNSRRGFTCVLHGGEDEATDRLDADGLVPRADRVLADLRDVFGDDLPVGGFAPGGVGSGHMKGSAHYEGRAVDVFVRPISRANKTRGWAIAAYLMSQADRLAIQTLIFDDRIWTRQRSAAGWRDYQVPTSSRGDRRILEHRDHVHVDVYD